MPFREKAKALFKTRSRGESLTKTNTKDSSREQYPSNVYKPGEPMPRPKYRTPPTKEHKEKLESFSFAEAWRRRSFQSQHSPMGTRAPSRRTSLLSLGRKKSVSSSHTRSYHASRNNSLTSEDTVKSGVRPREGGFAAARPTLLSTETEADGDDDVANVGLSRVQSKDYAFPPRPKMAEHRHSSHMAKARSQANGIPPIMNTAPDHQPFTEQELSLALQRSHLTVPAQ